MRLSRRRPDPDEPEAVPEALISLAREIHAEVTRIAADPALHGDLLTEVLNRAPRDERQRLARRIFDALDPDAQWRVLERVFSDQEISEYLRHERDVRRAELQQVSRHRQLGARARAAGALDTRLAEAGDVVVLGMFQARDVRAAVGRGHQSTAAARRLVLRALGGGECQVLEDVFNPNGGYFVTAAYTEELWRERERLDSHTIIRAGSIVGERFEPVLYPGGRVDIAKGADFTPGLLHLGFAMVGSEDVFVP